ncbi:glycosyltransferase family 28 domain-containing protein [Fusarium denticulatum]|uniref:Glycosyltransferase family 28 domain-containing protein n=1 Tax=Fusarium denticulatum TaxID=48507 RepID=A0A8H5XIX4_9HYPO|nr:glycosyltransferase family 28 domain-containing protein [Fusarium denticulatum]
MASPPPPFTVRILQKDFVSDGLESKDEFNSLLPASNRFNDDIVVPTSDPNFLERELSVSRLNDVQEWLWACGRPMPPRPLHHQRLISREIVISELSELHMIWWRNRIFLKPIPAYLLDPDFWVSNISDTAHLDVTEGNIDASARGFLFSYAALIAYKSDFRIAKEHGLLPEEVTWEGWKALTAQVLENHRYDRVNPRYWYGELRLSRLNKVYALRKGYLLRGYSRVASHTVYGDLIRDNFSVLAGILGYVVIALTAMQVGLGVDRLVENQAFQDVSYGLTVFTLIVPLIGALFIFFFVFIMIVSNWRVTKAFESRRLKKMKVKLLRKK